MNVNGLATSGHSVARVRFPDPARGRNGTTGAGSVSARREAEDARAQVHDLLVRSDTPLSPQSSAVETTPEERGRQLAAIRQRISKGFYNTDAVLEDLSTSFAGVFDKLS